MMEVLTDRRLRRIRTIAQRLRWLSLWSTTKAGSGHPSSCLSSADLAATLFFGGHFRGRPGSGVLIDDHFVLSKGHAAPLLYACAAVAGDISEKTLGTVRTERSKLQGHPMPGSPWTETPTGSLGQGLAIGAGLALAARRQHSSSRVYVLCGDSELAEGSNWEAINFAGAQRLHQLVTIVDMNGLGQRGVTMWGHHVASLAKMFSAAGWHTMIINGHQFSSIDRALRRARQQQEPTVIFAKTTKGFGLPLMAGKAEWHGKVLSPEQLRKAEQWIPNRPLAFTPTMATSLSHEVQQPRRSAGQRHIHVPDIPVAPRLAAAGKLDDMVQHDGRIVVLDPEVGNSTGVHAIEKKSPRQFVQGYIAESLVTGVATGFAHRGYIPVTATFGAFWTRAHDQLRMASYDGAHQVVLGTHAGVHIGEDGASQMALEDIALFRSLPQATVMAAADDVAAQRLLELSISGSGMNYLRLNRAPLPRMYSATTRFVRGGSHTLVSSTTDRLTVIAHGVTVSEAMRAVRGLEHIRVIDAYSILPLDTKNILAAAKMTHNILVVEDHRPAGGLGEAIAALVSGVATVKILSVKHIPHSATPAQALRTANIDHLAIRRAIQSWKP